MELGRRVRQHLNQEHRYAHSLRVARLAERLAYRHGESRHRARIAGMLHDLARLYPEERLLAECAQRGMPVNDYERAYPLVLHARVGAELATEMFGVQDPEILSAIRKHTLGDAQMSPLDCIVYVADTAEPGRTFPQRASLESLVMRDLTEATRVALELAIEHYQKKGLAAAPQTLAALQALGAAEALTGEVSDRSA
ncbi:MAG: bis(5'-nucleosyl)-tetraphosphatase (symmetrical) YqeK [Candidatus Eremiobacteraeota bacterium]|nr:bis(5'-nucleosyl)-tetraphosphatase (symmetrical) YqeK [Candidatus Eremiobacteraeota bacterium]